MHIQFCTGVPELKYVLGDDIKFTPNIYFNGRVLVAKVIGLCFSSGSLLVVGREGPYAHISGCVANMLMRRLKIFKYINLCDQIFILEI